MLFLENLKPLKIYKKPLFLPTIPTDKKKRSAIFLLTPNYESSKATMTSNLFVNRLRFASYYIEKDLTYFISSKAMDKVEDVTETYVRDFTEYDLYQSLCEMSAAERNALKDSTFGLPKKRKYPLNDEAHVRSAIRFFNYVDKEDEATLARNIKKAIKKFNMKVTVGSKNRFSNYYHPKAVTEEYEYISEDKLPAKERNALEDSSFGVPSKRKFPLNDKDHVKAAIRFFNKVDPEDEKTLARNLNKAINKFFSKEDRPKVGKNNRFAKYYAGPLTESSIYEGKVYDLGHDDYCYKFFDDNNEVCEVCIDYGDRYDPDNYIYELRVNPAYQKQGIGTALLEYATEVLGGDTLCVEKNNKVALHMYEEAGFEITGTNKQDQYIMSLGEDKLYAKERNALKDSTFGLPEKRKYPLNDESHVRSAIRFFNKVDKEDEAELARNIKKAIKKFGMKVKVGPENRFSNYYTSPATESALMEVSVSSNIDKDYESKGKKNLSGYSKETITKSMVEQYKELKHVRLEDETCAFFDGNNLVGYVAVEDKDDYYTWITALEITKDYQGYGLGEQLLKYAIDNMNANALSVNKNNKVAYEMYKKAGFYVFDDTDTMYFMTTDPVKAELNESTSSELDYIKHINDTLNSYDYYIKGAKRGDLDIKDFEIRWRLQSPKEVDKNKFGICWDFACYEDYMLTAANIPHSNYYVLLPDTKYKDTHTFVVAKLDDGRYAYMESSIKRDGMQGLFITNNLNDIFNHVISFMVDHGNDKPKAQKYLIYKYPDITDYGCDASKFESYCTKNDPILKGIMKPGTQDTLIPISEAAIEDPMKFISGLNEKLNKFEYGVKVNGKVTDKAEDLDKYYKTKSPEEFEKTKCGICYDFALYQDTKLKEAGIPHENYFVMIPENKRSNMTHTFTVAKVDGDYVYMESSFSKIGGVHIAKNLEDIFNYVVSNMIGDSKGEYEYFIVKTGKTKVGISIHDYIEEMYKKSTVVVSKYKGGKPTDKGIVTESADIENLYHLSPVYKDTITLNPSIPSNYMTKNGYEDNTTKRVCFSETINGCLIAMSKNLEGKELYVYSPIEDCEVYTPTEKELPDQKCTGEVWIKEPVKAKCIGKIVVGKAKDDPITYTYGDDKTADLYDWNYTMTETYDESALNEGYVKNSNDIYYNKDKYDSGKINLCFVTGHMGSGKSTMAAEMSKDPNTESYCMDDIKFNHNFTDQGLKEYGDLIYSFFKGPGKEFRVSPDDIDINHPPRHSREWSEKAITAFVKFAEDYAKKHKNKKFVIEGIQLYTNIKPEQLKDYAVCIKGTSAVVSAYRATKRDLEKAETKKQKISTAKKKVRYFKSAVTNDEKKIQQWRDYYQKLIDKQVEESAIISEDIIKDEPDIYYNKDKFDNGETNLCFITGHSGSGKSTLAGKKKDKDTVVIGLDHALCNIFYTLDDYKKSSDMEYAFYTDPKYNAKYYSDGSDTTKTINGQNFWDYWSDKDYDREACNDFVDFAIKWAKSHKDQKFIIEGIQLYTFIEPEKLKDYAVYIKGTSALKSLFRAAKRDSTDYEHKGTKLEKAKDIMHTGKMMIHGAKRGVKGIAGVDKYRKYFGKLTSTNEAVLGYLGVDGKERMSQHTNTPDTAIISASAIITDSKGKILIEDHEKCGGWSLPGGKEESETIENTICRELDEELNIGVDESDLKLICVNTFLCEYPNGSQSYTWFKDYCFYVKNYAGEIENMEPDKHEVLKFVSFEDLLQMRDDNEFMSTLLLNVIDYLEAYNRDIDDLSTDKLTYSGYTTDIDPVCSVINIDFYKSLLDSLGLEISNTYAPKVNIIVCDREDVETGIQQNGELVVNIFIPAIGDKKYNWSIESYEAYIASMMAIGVMKAEFQNVPIGIIGAFSRYILGLENDETEREFMDSVVKTGSVYNILQSMDKGEITPEDFYKKARKFGCSDKCFADKGSYVNEAKALDAEHLTNTIKYRTSTKQKKEFNAMKKNITDPSATVEKKDDKEDKLSETDAKKAKTIPKVNTSTEVSKEKITEEMIQALENDEYIIYGDYVTFFTEDSSNDTALRKILWSERMIKRKEVVALLDRVKADCPFIKYAYPELNRYQQKNLFVDLYYYNQAFFKNNEWKALKAFNLYKDLLDRLINDKRIKNAGYERRTVFIPINDWHKNPSTRMWMYKEDLNPISVIYQLMMTNPSALQKLFKDVGVVFFSKDKYFTVDFSQPIDKKTALKFRTFITKINKGEEFDSEDVDSTENTPSKESIKTTIMDDIEDAKGVDLTSANNKVQSEPKEGPNASIGDKPPTRTMAVKTPEAKKEERNKPAVKATAAKPAVTAASLTAAASKKYEKQAEKLVKQQNDEVKDVEKTMSKTTVNKPVTDDKIKQDEEVQKAIVRSIDSHVYDKVDVTDVDDVYDDMDYDDTLKDLLVSLDSMKDDSVNISQARADRMNNLDRELLDKSLKGRTIREILDKDSDPTKPIEMPKTDLKVGSPNPEWKDLHYMNFDKTYDLEKDIVNAFEHFTTTSRPMAIRNITAEDNSSSEDYIDTYTCEYEDYRGKRYTIKLDIPKVKNERFVLRGNKRMLQTQFFNMPIVKTADDVCQIVTNYKKIIISRYNTATGKSLPNVARLIKAADKYNGRRIKFTPGDNTLICTKYNLPIDYIDLSTAFSKIETDEYVIYFNQDEIRKQYEVNDANGTPFAIDKLHDSLIYYPNDETRPFIDTLMAMITWKSDGTIDEKFDELYKSMKAPAKGTYTRAKIMGAEIPLVVVCAYHDGLTTVMKKSNIMYELVDKLTSEIRSDINKDWIRFKDGYLVFNVDYNSSLLMNGLKDCDTIQYSMMDIDDKNMYLDFLDNFGGRIKADGLENFYDCEIDPISKETLAYYKLPTEYVSVLLYANRLLSDNKFIKHTDASSRRARRFELIAAYTYQVLAEAYSSYSTSVKHNRNGATFSCKQSAVIDKILQDPTSSDYSTINMLNDIESTNAITTKGLSGLNADRSYSLDKRTFDDSMLDVVGMSTGFSQNTGITRQATMDMNIKGERGYVKDIHGNTKDMNTAKTLTATEAVVPLSTTHDDPFRVAMTFIQSSKHAVRTEHSDPLLVTNGADEALPYMCSDQFAYKAKQNGTIKELDDQGMIVEYDDGSKEYVDLSETIEKNSDGGFYVPLKLDADSKLKVGSKVKKNQILAYDKSSLSNSAGEDDNLAYNVGALCKIAIINTDEGFEDSGIVTEDLAEKLTTKIIYMEDCILDKNTNIYNMAKVGQKVEQGDTLLVWQTPYDEEEVNNLLKALADDREAISELGRHTVKSEVTGKVVGIKMYRTVELDDLSDSLKKALSDYEKPISDLKKRLEDEDIDTSTLPANYPLKPAGKLKKAGDGVLIEFYVEYDDIVGIGDKITYNAANKAVIKNVIPRGKEPYTDFRPNEKISALVSSTSIAKRMVTSTRVYGYLQKLMIELDRSCKDMAGIPYDDSTV